MGVDLGDITVRHPTTLASLSGKIIAIDAFNVLYQFLASIRQEDGTPLMDYKGRITAHLSGLLYRSSRLIENGIKPVYVFDGPPPPFKLRTIEERAKTKKEAEEKWKKALEEERYEDARSFAQGTSRLTSEMIEESKQLLTAMGIPFIQAPTEGEAYAAALVKNGAVHASASQDYDSLLFGSPVLIRNISITGRRKVPRQNTYITIEPEEIKLSECLDSVNITQEQLIHIGILVGTDFNEGVPRVGPKTALKVAKEHLTFDSIKKFVKEKYAYEFEDYIETVILFFKSQEAVEKPTFRFTSPDDSSVIRLMCDEHDFSNDRIENVLANLKKNVKEKGAQRKLETWFG